VPRQWRTVADSLLQPRDHGQNAAGCRLHPIPSQPFLVLVAAVPPASMTTAIVRWGGTAAEATSKLPFSKSLSCCLPEGNQSLRKQTVSW
jgi:hypothetical protein